mgnify:CR=1 FL=1
MPRTRFTILGSSAGLPQADRATSGYLLTVGGRHLLVDCGGGICSSFRRRGFNPRDVDRIIISHTHPDHCCELPLFLQMMYLMKRADPVDIYLPEEFVEPFRALQAAMYIPPEKLSFEPRLHGYGDGFTLDTDRFTLVAHANNHLAHNTDLFDRLGWPNRGQSHSLVISVGEKHLLYSGDIKGFDDIRHLIDGCEYVITETTHIDMDPFLTFAQHADVGRFIITHLADDDNVMQINAAFRKAGLDNFVCAVDGMELPL